MLIFDSVDDDDDDDCHFCFIWIIMCNITKILFLSPEQQNNTLPNHFMTNFFFRFLFMLFARFKIDQKSFSFIIILYMVIMKDNQRVSHNLDNNVSFFCYNKEFFRKKVLKFYNEKETAIWNKKNSREFQIVVERRKSGCCWKSALIIMMKLKWIIPIIKFRAQCIFDKPCY